MTTFVVYLSTTETIEVDADTIYLGSSDISLHKKDDIVATFPREKIFGIVDKATLNDPASENATPPVHYGRGRQLE